MIRRRLVVTGRVQNVFYRDWFVEQARALGLDGWVRNRADTSVEAVVQGAPEMVDAMVARARRGSPASRVEAVAVTDDARVRAHEPVTQVRGLGVHVLPAQRRRKGRYAGASVVPPPRRF